MKCHQYWPNPDSSTTYGDFTVTCHNEEGNSAFLVREMTLVHTQVNTRTHKKDQGRAGNQKVSEEGEGDAEEDSGSNQREGRTSQEGCAP